MTQVIFPTIVYRQIVSLIIYCITIPVGQKFTNCTLSWLCLKTAWKIPENDIMALEASDRLIDIIWVNWRFTCGCISRPTFKRSASLLDIMGKSKKISQDLRKNCRPPQVWFILRSNFQMPEGTMFICTNNSTNTMGPRTCHTAQEGDAFCLLEMNILWCEKCKSIPEQQQRTLWRCWRKQVQKYLYPQ